MKGFPAKLRGQRPSKLPHSPWMLLEHLRIAQRDILEFSCNAKYVSPNWPDDYWPEAETPPNPAAWDKSIRQFRRDLKAVQTLVANPKTDLFARIPWGDGTNDFARSAAGSGSQRLPPGSISGCPPSFGCVGLTLVD